jgi:hypothetical protein
MSILSQKQKVFGKIAAAKTLTQGFPKLKVSSSFPSINNNGDSITFLCDLLKSLIGYESLQDTIGETLTYSMNLIETEIKSALKAEIKSIVSCGTNPSLPDFIKSTGDGISIPLQQIDFTDLMHVDPNSNLGSLLYNDITKNLLDSTDFNTFLYQTVQNNGSIESWSGLLTLQFKSTDVSGINPNNTLTIKADSAFDNKTLTDLNNTFIDSLKLFNTENLLSKLIDIVFGTVSSNINKTLKQLEIEAKVNSVINKISNSDSNSVINDKYFSFTNIENNLHQIDAMSRKKGIKNITTSEPISTSIGISTLKETTNSINDAISMTQKKLAVTKSLNTLGNEISNFATNVIDKKALKLNFIQELVNTLIKAIVNTILSPKVIILFLINFKIIYGPNATYSDPIDFLKKNKNFIHNITKRITSIIIKILLQIALKEIKKLVSDSLIKQQIDKNQANISQLLSLVGVPQDVLRLLKGLS